MKNDRLYSYMKKKGISIKILSELSGIPKTTLSRIVNDEIKNVKMTQKEAIAKALNVPISVIFQDIPFDEPLLAAIRPDDAGSVLTKTLSEDESLLLYFYQNCTIERREQILNKAKADSISSQKEIAEKVYDFSNTPKPDYTQLSFDDILQEHIFES